MNIFVSSLLTLMILSSLNADGKPGVHTRVFPEIRIANEVEGLSEPTKPARSEKLRWATFGFLKLTAALVFSANGAQTVFAQSHQGILTDQPKKERHLEPELYQWDHESGLLRISSVPESNLIRIKLLTFEPERPKNSMQIRDFYVVGSQGLFSLYDNREFFAELSDGHDYFFQVTPFQSGSAKLSERRIIGRRTLVLGKSYKTWQSIPIKGHLESFRQSIVVLLKKEIDKGNGGMISEEAQVNIHDINRNTLELINRLEKKSILDRFSF